MTPDSPERLYSTRLRTALVLIGSGTAGAYHAGVLRALHEAGVRTDLVAGRGMGAVSAMFAAVDGGARLWDATGIWKGPGAARLYSWRLAVRVAGWAVLAAGAILLFPLLLWGCAIVVGAIGLVLTLIGFEATASALTVGFTERVGALFAPAWLPTILPRLVLLAALVAAISLGAGLAARSYGGRTRRRVRHGVLWRLAGAPLSSTAGFDAFASDLWKLIRGAAPFQRPKNSELGRRYIELLGENLGQPGFRELLAVIHDLDARQDVVFAFLGEAHRHRFFGPSWSASGIPRASEAVDLAGVGRVHGMDVLAASLALPLGTEPHMIRFPAEGHWRGETHRACDRPGAVGRVLEEVAAAGAEQVILVSACPRPGRPHELSAHRGDLRGQAGEQLSAFEAAALRDVLETFAGRFAGLHVIRPDHNPLGPLDVEGVHDERSDRDYPVAELVDRGYEDAYRQFVDPIVGAGGERMQSLQPGYPQGLPRGAVEP